jgi:putative hydrolase of the HAD superfamily
VLILPDVDLVRKALAGTGARPHARALDYAHDVGIAAYDRAGGEEGGYQAFLAAYVRAAGVRPSAAELAAKQLDTAIKATSNAWSRVRPGARPGLQAICKRGVDVAVVSNSNGTVEQSLRLLCICQVGPGLGSSIAAVLDSRVVGLAKPDPRIFRLALSEVGAPAERAVHVGDSVQADVEGARAAGIRPLHFDPHRLCAASDHEHAVSLIEVANLIG